MKKKKIYIRADGGSEIGLGHLVRCFALAQMLKKEFIICFFSKKIPDNISNDIIDHGFSFENIDSEKDFLTVLSGNEIVVLDHYGLNSDYQKRIKKIGCKLVCIDDLHDKEFYADLIINHAPGIKPEDYIAQQYTQFALGLNYALLRSEFLEAAKEKKVYKNIQTVFICFGGSDPKNLTERCLNVVLNTNKFERIFVIVGTSFQNMDQIKSIATNNSKIKLFHSIDAKEMLNLMKTSDLAIVPASGILLEVLAVGLKVISGMYVENQKYLFQSYKEAGFFVNAQYFSEEDLSSAIREVKDFQPAPLADIDGRSGSRIVKLFKGLIIEDEIKLRKAKIEDIKITFKWATDPLVRKYSFSKDEIKYHDHSEWFLNKLDNFYCFYFIAELNNEIIGSIRYDIQNDEAIINFLIDPRFHGRGFGIIILKLGYQALMNYNLNIKKVVGYVMKENVASIKAFQKLSYNSCFTANGNYKFIKKT